MTTISERILEEAINKMARYKKEFGAIPKEIDDEVQAAFRAAQKEWIASSRIHKDKAR